MNEIKTFQVELELPDSRGCLIHVNHCSKLSTSSSGEIDKNEKIQGRRFEVLWPSLKSVAAANPRKILQFLCRMLIVKYNKMIIFWHDAVNSSNFKLSQFKLSQPTELK